jgi:phage minor structural protein
MRPLSVYDYKTGKRLAFLQNAYNISYEQHLNSLWTAEFTLPYSDEKKIYCQPFNLVEVWDVETRFDFSDVSLTDPIPGGPNAGRPIGLLSAITNSGYTPPKPGTVIPPVVTEDDRYVGLFRIMPTVESKNLENTEITYTLEHVMGTLLDDYIVGSLEFEADESTASGLEKILSRQSSKRWSLNECDYEEYFPYEFLDMNLLAACYYIAGPLPDTYYWSFDTQNFPWVLNLKRATSTPVTDIRYQKNIFGIKKTSDPRSLCTRLYLYGKDRLSFSSINGGKEFVESAEGISNYGVITSVIHDNRFETRESLYAYGVALIEKLARSFVTYEIDVKAIRNASSLRVGDTVRVVTDDGLDQNLVVQQISKSDLRAKPNSGKIIIGEGTKNIGLVVKSVI